MLRKQNSKFIILSLVIITASLLSPVSPAKSQGAISPSLSISPALVRQNIKPGKKTIVKITISNLGQNPIPLSVAKYNISGINNSGAPEFTAAARPHSGAEWLKVSQPDLILDALGSREIEVTISPPDGTNPGGYSAALIFQARLPDNYFDPDANTRVIPALSTSFLLSVDAVGASPTIENLSISSFQTPKIVVSTPIPFLIEISNPTGFFFFTDGELTLTPTWGKQKIVIQLANSVLMPQSSRQYTSAYTGTIWPGIYDAKFALNQDGKVLVANSRFVAVPWPFIIIVPGVLVLAILLVRRYRRTARQANPGS